MKFLMMILAMAAGASASAANVDLMKCGGGDTESTFVTITQKDGGAIEATVEFNDSVLDRSAQFLYPGVQVSTSGATVYLAKNFSLTVEPGLGLRKGTLQLPAIHVFDQVLSCGY